jgi:KDO2-lipid IV(A) lauroyltransferase
MLSRLPLPVLYPVADSLYVLLFHLLRYHRDVVTGNLRRAFPQMTEDAILALAKRNYRHTLHVLVETIRGLSIDEQDLGRRVDIDNPELLDGLLEKYNTVITGTTHQCNWEWLLLAYASYADFRLAVLYKRINRAELDALLYEMRSRFGSTPVEARSGLGGLLRFARRPGVVALAADLGPRIDEPKYWSRFLGVDTAL